MAAGYHLVGQRAVLPAILGGREPGRGLHRQPRSDHQTAYGMGLPSGGSWQGLLNTGSEVFGGSGAAATGTVSASETGLHGLEHSAQLTLPPLGVLWLCPDGQ